MAGDSSGCSQVLFAYAWSVAGRRRWMGGGDGEGDGLSLAPCTAVLEQGKSDSGAAQVSWVHWQWWVSRAKGGAAEH